MIVYAIELDVEAALADEYLPWLRAHVHEMLDFPGFMGAEIFERLEPAPDPGRVGYNVHYRLRDRADFEAYLREHAARMREQGLRAFGERVRARRSLLQAAE
jgi:antibiotic biosynthesis monooxygenase (ABM) superfamily enzyme